jgi:hypothetical protein
VDGGDQDEVDVGLTSADLVHLSGGVESRGAPELGCGAFRAGSMAPVTALSPTSSSITIPQPICSDSKSVAISRYSDR